MGDPWIGVDGPIFDQANDAGKIWWQSISRCFYRRLGTVQYRMAKATSSVVMPT